MECYIKFKISKGSKTHSALYRNSGNHMGLTVGG